MIDMIEVARGTARRMLNENLSALVQARRRIARKARIILRPVIDQIIAGPDEDDGDDGGSGMTLGEFLAGDGEASRVQYRPGAIV